MENFAPICPTPGNPPATRRHLYLKTVELKTSKRLDRALVSRYLRKQLPEVRECLRDTWDSKVNAEFSVRFPIQSLTANVEVDGSPAGVSTCISDAFSKIRFPAEIEKGWVQVTYRINDK